MSRLSPTNQDLVGTSKDRKSQKSKLGQYFANIRKWKGI